MTILIAYASKHGATREIAEHIAEQLRQTGKETEARAVDTVEHPESYEALVIGSAIYYGSWLKAVRSPEGDFRDWEAINAWAASIARELVIGSKGALV